MAQPFVEPCSRGIIAAEPCPRELGRETSPRRRRMVLAACVLASSMVFIDGTALTVALPRLRADFGADLASVQWVLNGYMLALASLTLIGGALADVYGKARMLALGCVLFGLASAACALAPSPAWLIAARVVQGVAAAIVAPASLALIGATYPRDGAKRGDRRMGSGIGSDHRRRSRPGRLADRDLRLAVRVLDQPAARARRSRESLLVFAPKDGRSPRQVRRDRCRDPGFGAWGARLGAQPDRPQRTSGRRGHPGPDRAPSRRSSPGSALSGSPSTHFWERRSAHPMTPPRLVENRAFLGLELATLMVYAGLSIMFFLLPFDLVDRRALSSTDAGLAFLPFTLGVGLLSRRLRRPGGQDWRAAHAHRGAGRCGARLCLDGTRPGSFLDGRRDRPHDAAGPILRHSRGATDGVRHVECGSSRHGARLRHQQCGEPDCATCRRSTGRRCRVFPCPATKLASQ